MKRMARCILLFGVLITFVGCEKPQQCNEEKQTEIEEYVQTTETVETIREKEVEEKTEIDVDLTQMGSDMVYATVYQMMVDPESYVGKTIRIRGNYYATWYEQTQKYYHYVIIQDATACCSQGMEFVWENGTHKYPEEYPAEETEVEVTGVFETYTEEGDENLYCRLKDAVWNIPDIG